MKQEQQSSTDDDGGGDGGVVCGAIDADPDAVVREQEGRSGACSSAHQAECQHNPSVRVINLIASRFTMRVETCQHVRADAIYTLVAMTLKTQPWRVALLNKAEQVSRGQNVFCEGEKGWSWVVASLPLTTTPKDFKLRIKAQVDLGTRDERCSLCKGQHSDSDDATASVLLEDALREHLGSEERETQEMQQNDCNVQLVHVRGGSSVSLYQCAHGISVKDFLDDYARVKRVKRSHAQVLSAETSGHIMQQDRLYYVHRTMARGGAVVDIQLLTDAGELVDLAIEEEATAREVIDTYAPTGQALFYRGARVSDNMPLSTLSDTMFYLQEDLEETRFPNISVIRPRTTVLHDGMITLAELCEWFQEPCRDLDTIPDRGYLDRIIHRWTSHNAMRWRRIAWARGGGKGDSDVPSKARSRPQWESTPSLKGLELLTEVRIEEEVLTQIPCATISQESKGVCLILIGTWSQLTTTDWKGPLLLLFPGACDKVLYKLGAVTDRVSVTEVLLRTPEGGSPFSKRVTAYSLSNHTYQMGKNIEHIAWCPQSSSEAILEFDSRWAHEIATQSVKQDWLIAAKRMLASMASASVSDLPIYAIRHPTDLNPHVWSLKVRMSAEIFEKVLASSGREALFARPAVGAELIKTTHAIVWAARHDESNPEKLASIQQVADKMIGHKGLAHSAMGLGLRCPWERVKDARTALRPNDPRWTTANVALLDKKTFVLRNCPPGATPQDISKIGQDLSWNLTPQRQLIRGQVCSWVVTAQEGPPKEYFRWANHNVTVQEQDQDTLDKQRKQSQKKRSTAMTLEHRSTHDKPDATVNVRSSSGSKDDPLQRVDPWSGWKDVAEKASPAGSAASPPQHKGYVIPNDPRVSTLLARVDVIESNAMKMDQRIDGLDGKVGTLQDTVENRFTEVLQALAGLAQGQAEEAKRKKPQGS